MPINSGRGGFAGVLGVPALGARGPGRSGRSGRSGRTFKSQPLSASSIYISGVTRDSASAALAGCTVSLYQSSGPLVATTTSDASGAYSFPVLVAGPFFIVAYKAGAPDVAGTTVNTLNGA